MTKSQHTPLPWRAIASEGYRVQNGPYPDGGGNVVIMADAIFGNTVANADFIVAACNSHYELLSAVEHLRGCLEHARKMLAGEVRKNSNDVAALADRVKQYDSLIARAKGGAA
ncbi:hypothetical protein [Acidicapsa acidisoli]|uniref:hypothetical protein n=1 Tax=Acidicapsa acidisoli TaxID=1615681 RepID=UPI0021E07370|nr:hypothetical protein [Acidicapsa acidisoli]